MTSRLASRLLPTIGLLALLGLGVALISQHVFGLRPCAWCVLQRLILLAIVVVCVLTGYGPWRWLRRLGALLAALLAAGGVAAAWYQYAVASQAFSCAQTFADRFMSGLGLDAALPWLFGIYASCMDARVRVLGVEYAIWAMVLFALLFVLAVLAWWRAPRRRR